MLIFLKSGGIIVLKRSGPVQACTGIVYLKVTPDVGLIWQGNWSYWTW